MLVTPLKRTDITIDRVHRITKPAHFHPDIPRDILVRVHYFHVKERILQAAKTTKPLPAPYTNILLFNDLSKQLWK